MKVFKSLSLLKCTFQIMYGLLNFVLFFLKIHSKTHKICCPLLSDFLSHAFVLKQLITAILDSKLDIINY